MVEIIVFLLFFEGRGSEWKLCSLDIIILLLFSSDNDMVISEFKKNKNYISLAKNGLTLYKVR